MRLPLPKKEAQRKRLKEWKNWLLNFRKQYNENKNKPSFTYIPNAAWVLNNVYWRLAEQYLRPILRTDGEEEHKIHHYKIISASEIAVMMTEPITVKGNESATKRLNAGLAWFVANQIMEGWETGSQVKIGVEQMEELSYFKENIEKNKKYPESFAAEHVQWLTMLNVTIEKPLLLNAQCWRLYYLACLALAGNGKLK